MSAVIYGPGELIPDRWFVYGFRRSQTGDWFYFLRIKMPWKRLIYSVTHDEMRRQNPVLFLRWSVL